MADRPSLTSLFPPQLFATFGTIFLFRNFVDPENEVHVNAVRVLYIAVHVAIGVLMMICYRKASNSNEGGLVQVTEQLIGEDKPRVFKISTQEYDKREVMSTLKKLGFAVGLTAFLHLKYDFLAPMAIQPVLQVFNMFKSPLIKIHIRGERAMGKLKRPWEDTSNPFKAQLDKLNKTLKDASQPARAKEAKSGGKKKRR